MTHAWPFAIALAIACGGGGGGATGPIAPVGPPVNEHKAEKDAKGLLVEIYQSIDHADVDGLMSLLAEPLIVFGPRRIDALANRADALVALKEVVDPKAKGRAQLQSGGVAVFPAPGGHSAWAFDVVNIAGEPHVVTCVMSNTDDLWTVNVAAVARTPSMKEVRAKLKEEAIVPPGMAGVPKLDERAEGAADKLRRGMLDQKIWGDDLASRTDAVVIGPGAGDITRSKKDIKKQWDHRLKSNLRMAPVGDITAGTSADGMIAWASSAVVRFEDDDDPLPLRVFAIFEKNNSDWTLIALAESLALDAPGVGGNLKKIQAPSLAPKVEEPKPDEPKKKKDKKDKKDKSDKKKKKKKHKDDD